MAPNLHKPLNLEVVVHEFCLMLFNLDCSSIGELIIRALVGLRA